MAAASRRLVADHGWVDSAIHDAAGGVTDTALSTAIAGVVTAARERRAVADGEYAEALARACRTGDGTSGVLAGDGDPVHPLEHLLRTLVVPLAKVQPALLIVPTA